MHPALPDLVLTDVEQVLKQAIALQVKHLGVAMSTQFTSKPTGPLAPQYVNFVYIPSVILIAGTAAFNLKWIPLAVAIAAALGGFQVFQNRTFNTANQLCVADG